MDDIIYKAEVNSKAIKGCLTLTSTDNGLVIAVTGDIRLTEPMAIEMGLEILNFFRLRRINEKQREPR